MPWVRATLRGQRVFVRANADGTPSARGGKVEIRYKPDDGRMYQANPKNLLHFEPEVLPDDTCAEASAAPSATEKAPKATDSQKAPRARAPKATSSGDSGAAADPGGPDRTVVYTDGACTGNPGPAGLGVVVLLPESRIEISEYLGHGTNNIAELTAILRGIEEAPPAGHLVVHTDSQYAIGVLSKNWKAKANVELIAEIREKMRARRRVSFVYVRGHAGVPLNERCDKLARLAIQTRKTTRETLVIKRIPPPEPSSRE